MMLQEILAIICSKPTDVHIRQSDRTLVASVSKTDLGRVLGRKAEVFQSLRTLVAYTQEATLAPILGDDGSDPQPLKGFVPDSQWSRPKLANICKLITRATGAYCVLVQSHEASGEVAIICQDRRMINAVTVVVQAAGMALGASIVIEVDEGNPARG